jgi:hypothetical protein
MIYEARPNLITLLLLQYTFSDTRNKRENPMIYGHEGNTMTHQIQSGSRFHQIDNPSTEYETTRSTAQCG